MKKKPPVKKESKEEPKPSAYGSDKAICKNASCKLRKQGCKGFEGCPGFLK